MVSTCLGFYDSFILDDCYPYQVGIGTAFTVGILLDLLTGTILG
ncbi:MAG: hypothetical protein AB8V52_01570 [Coxiella endosymbiont of Dermacentor nuttalli]